MANFGECVRVLIVSFSVSPGWDFLYLQVLVSLIDNFFNSTFDASGNRFSSLIMESRVLGIHLHLTIILDKGMRELSHLCLKFNH